MRLAPREYVKIPRNMAMSPDIGRDYSLHNPGRPVIRAPAIETLDHPDRRPFPSCEPPKFAYNNELLYRPRGPVGDVVSEPSFYQEAVF